MSKWVQGHLNTVYALSESFFPMATRWINGRIPLSQKWCSTLYRWKQNVIWRHGTSLCLWWSDDNGGGLPVEKSDSPFFETEIVRIVDPISLGLGARRRPGAKQFSTSTRSVVLALWFLPVEVGEGVMLVVSLLRDLELESEPSPQAPTISTKPNHLKWKNNTSLRNPTTYSMFHM